MNVTQRQKPEDHGAQGKATIRPHESVAEPAQLIFPSLRPVMCCFIETILEQDIESDCYEPCA